MQHCSYSIARSSKVAAFAATAYVAFCSQVVAQPTDFTWTPSGATPVLNGGSIVDANNLNVSDFSSVNINFITGTFTETGVLGVPNFLNGGSIVAAPGLGSDYSLYLRYSGTGTLPGVPSSPGTSTNGTLTTLSYQLIGSSAGSPSVLVGNSGVAVSDPGNQAILGFGNLVAGTGIFTLTRTADGLSPTTNMNVTFNPCRAAGQGGVCGADQSAFFTSPTLPPLQLSTLNFSATDTVTRVTQQGSVGSLMVVGGGGNQTFQAGTSTLPPGSGSIAAPPVGVPVGANATSFTWAPSGATPALNGGSIVDANNAKLTNVSSITVNPANGTFLQSGALRIPNFLKDGTNVPAPGLGSDYNLFLVYSGTGTLNGLPSTFGTSTNGNITTMSYKLVGSDPSDPADVAILGFGNLVPGKGIVTFIKTANGLSPTENFDLTFNECEAAGQGGVCTGDESDFFAASTLSGLTLNFSASDTVTDVNFDGALVINVNGGGGNATFQGIESRAVPEPGTLTLLGVGLGAALLAARGRGGRRRG